MRPVVLEVLSHINDGFQSLGVVLIIFKIVTTFSFIIIFTNQIAYVLSEGIITPILLTLNLILALTATKLLTRAESVRRYVALVLLSISQLLTGIVIIIDIAGAVIVQNLIILTILYIITIVYYFLFVVLSQSVLMTAATIIKYEKAKPSVVPGTS